MTTMMKSLWIVVRKHAVHTHATSLGRSVRLLRCRVVNLTATTVVRGLRPTRPTQNQFESKPVVTVLRRVASNRFVHVPQANALPSKIVLSPTRQLVLC